MGATRVLSIPCEIYPTPSSKPFEHYFSSFKKDLRIILDCPMGVSGTEFNYVNILIVVSEEVHGTYRQ